MVPVEGGAAVDLTPGGDDAPPFSLGDEDWSVSPDGQEACFSRKDRKDEAWSTNADVFVVPTAGGAAEAGLRGPAATTGAAAYSPDGSLLAWRAQLRAGYEADRWRLVVLDRKTGARADADGGARPRGRSLRLLARLAARSYFTGRGGGAIPRALRARGGRRGRDRARRRLRSATSACCPTASTLVGTRGALTHPAEIVRFGADGAGLTRVTPRRTTRCSRPSPCARARAYATRAPPGKSVQAWLVKPPAFDPARKYPLLVLVHGGPQGAWTDGWTYRWNAQVFASAGYVVFMPNPRGSIGWGQEFTDDINRRLGREGLRGRHEGDRLRRGAPLRGEGPHGRRRRVLRRLHGQLDRGAHGPLPALVSHDGVFDLVSMYGSTEELWFPEWELGGPYWANPEGYARWNPRDFVKGFKTPTLVVHGETDYRVPVEQGLAMFTALRRQGVPARLLVFPDENHWVLKPANSVRWYDEVLGWLDRWTKK